MSNPGAFGAVVACLALSLTALWRVLRDPESRMKASDLVALVRSRRGRLTLGQQYWSAVALGCLVLAIVFAFLAWSMPDAQEAKAIVQRVLGVSPAAVESVVVQPASDPADIQLITGPVTIRDRQIIREICTALNSAETYSPNHPVVRWCCLLKLKTGGGTVECSVMKLFDGDTMIRIQSTDGWIVGTYKQNRLGELLEKAMRDSCATKSSF